MRQTEKRRPGRPFEDRPEKGELQRLYVKEGKSIRETASCLNCSKDLVARALKEYGIQPRPNVQPRPRKSYLEKYQTIDLEADIKRLGIRGAARMLGVPNSTLRQYVKKVKGQ